MRGKTIIPGFKVQSQTEHKYLDLYVFGVPIFQ